MSEAATTEGKRWKSVPERIKERPIIHRKMWSRMHQKDKNWMGVVAGETGSGKSLLALRLCEILDPDFSADQIAFTIQEFLELVADRSYGEGSMILFDEVGIALSHAKHYEEDVIRVNHVLQSWREQNRGLVMTSPHLHLIAKADRGLLHSQMDMWGINHEHWCSRARYRNIRQHSDSGNLFKPYPKLRDPDTGRKREYRFLTVYKPTPDLIDQYLERKIEFNDEVNQRALEEATGADELDERSPKELVPVIKNKGIGPIVSIHQGHNKAQIDSDLIRAEYNVSHGDAKAIKKLMEKDDDISLEEYEP